MPRWLCFCCGSGAAFYYATEARPLAPRFMCFSCLLLAGDIATTNESRAIAPVGGWGIECGSDCGPRVWSRPVIAALPGSGGTAVSGAAMPGILSCALDSFAGSYSGHCLAFPSSPTTKHFSFRRSFKPHLYKWPSSFTAISSRSVRVCVWRPSWRFSVRTRPKDRLHAKARLVVPRRHGAFGGPTGRTHSAIIENFALLFRYGVPLCVLRRRSLFRLSSPFSWPAGCGSTALLPGRPPSALAYLLTAHNVVLQLSFGSTPMDTSSSSADQA